MISVDDFKANCASAQATEKIRQLEIEQAANEAQRQRRELDALCVLTGFRVSTDFDYTASPVRLTGLTVFDDESNVIVSGPPAIVYEELLG